MPWKKSKNLRAGLAETQQNCYLLYKKGRAGWKPTKLLWIYVKKEKIAESAEANKTAMF